MPSLDCRDEIILRGVMPNKEDVLSLCNFFYAFSDNTRLRIIILLTVKPLCVNDISQILSLNQTTLSHQLKILKSLNIVDCDRNGKSIIYYIKNPSIQNVLDCTVDCI